MTDMSEFGAGEEGLTDYEYLIQHNAVWRRHRKTLNEIIDLIEVGNYEEAHTTWEQDIPHEDQIILNRAKSKGGWLWPHERAVVVKGMDAPSGWSYGLAGVHTEIK